MTKDELLIQFYLVAQQIIDDYYESRDENRIFYSAIDKLERLSDELDKLTSPEGLE